MSDEKERPHHSWFMYHLKGDFNGIIFMPYVYRDHWCLFVVDTNKKTTMHLDPFFEDWTQSSKRTTMCNKNFLQYLKISRNFVQNNWNSSKIKWKRENLLSQSRPLRPPGDSFNCGLFVLHDMDILGRKETFDPGFNPIIYRADIAKLLLEKSECMEQVCQFCFSSIMGENFSYQCKQCKRFMHEKCLGRLPNFDSKNSLCILCTSRIEDCCGREVVESSDKNKKRE